jgi:hypothetical protein
MSSSPIGSGAIGSGGSSSFSTVQALAKIIVMVANKNS